MSYFLKNPSREYQFKSILFSYPRFSQMQIFYKSRNNDILQKDKLTEKF